MKLTEKIYIMQKVNEIYECKDLNELTHILNECAMQVVEGNLKRTSYDYIKQCYSFTFNELEKKF